MNVAIELPKEIASNLAESPDDLSRVALEALEQGYRDGKLTHAEVQQMLGFDSRSQTDAFLQQAGAYLDYSEADLECDLETSRQIALLELSTN